VLSLGVLVGSEFLGTSTRAEESLIEAFLREAPPKWLDYEKKAKDLQGLATVRVQRGDTSATSFSSVELRHNNDCSLLFGRTGIGESPDAVFAFNTKYSFALKGSEAAKSWKITKLEMDKERLEPVVATELQAARDVIAIMVMPHHRKLTELIARRSFRVTNATYIDHPPDQLVEIEFTNDHPPHEKPFCPIQGGTLRLDPQSYWVARSGDLRLRYPSFDMRVHFVSTSRSGEKALPVPVKYEEWREIVGQPPSKRQYWLREFDLKQLSTLPPENEFTLTAFGLPEPPGVTWKKPTPWWLWTSLGGIAMLVLGAGLGWLRKRFAARAAA